MTKNEINEMINRALDHNAREFIAAMFDTLQLYGAICKMVERSTLPADPLRSAIIDAATDALDLTGLECATKVLAGPTETAQVH